MLQIGGATPGNWVDLLSGASRETKVILAITVLFSVISWFIIVYKWWQFRRLRRQADRFFAELERTTRIEDAYRAVMRLPASAYTRLFREGIAFVSDLRPGGGGEGAVVAKGTLTGTQLEAFKMVLAKDIAAERDALAHYIPWLATVGSVGPLLGLLGTVLGVMDAFIGISARGSGNIAAVAPGVAEALVTTVAGLATAIPAVIGYNIFVGRLNAFAAELEGFANELIGTMAREGVL
ncbi:MAG: MotA/TolQ/ExbB proton channel family protein [Gemmatimonadales bacterium]